MWSSWSIISSLIGGLLEKDSKLGRERRFWYLVIYGTLGILKYSQPKPLREECGSSGFGGEDGRKLYTNNLQKHVGQLKSPLALGVRENRSWRQ